LREFGGCVFEDGLDDLTYNIMDNITSRRSKKDIQTWEKKWFCQFFTMVNKKGMG